MNPIVAIIYPDSSEYKLIQKEEYDEIAKTQSFTAEYITHPHDNLYSVMVPVEKNQLKRNETATKFFQNKQPLFGPIIVIKHNDFGEFVSLTNDIFQPFFDEMIK